MRFIILTIVILLPLRLLSQTFEINFPNEVVTSSINSNTDIPLTITNKTSEKIFLMIERSNQFLGAGQTAKLKFPSKKDAFDRIQIEIAPNTTVDSLIIEFYSGINEISGRIDFNVINLSNTADVENFHINYDVSITRTENLLYTRDKLSVSNFFPNPAQDIATIDYFIPINEKEIKIIIQNLLGSIVAEYQLDPLDLKLTVNTKEMTPGVYFYTLFINEEGVITKKLVVRR